MRATEDLLALVRDPRSRAQLLDGIRAYEAGALRACIISTWVAVALDLTSKIREIAESGDAAAVAWVVSLNNAISSADVAKLGKIENQLLDASRDSFQLLSDRDHEELLRLQRDRHVCAHPAFVRPDEVFAPTPEACRAHLAVAVDSVLSQRPTAGKAAIDRFTAESQALAWPLQRDSLAAHLEATYFTRTREATRKNLLQVIVKACLSAPNGDNKLRRRMVQAAHAVDTFAPNELEQAITEVVRKQEELSGLGDPALLNLVGGLGDLSATWTALPPTSHPRAEALVLSAPMDELIAADVISEHLLTSVVGGAVSTRLADLTDEKLRTVIESSPSRVLVPPALKALADSGSWRSAESNVYGLIIPLATYLNIENLQSLSDTLQSNSQVREASGMPPAIDTLYDQTKGLPGAAEVWAALSAWLVANGGGSSHYYTYPSLAARVAADTAAHLP